MAKNSKLNIDNPIIVGKYIRAQSFTIENGNDKVFARFQNELNGMEHMRTGPLLIRQQIVMQVFKTEYHSHHIYMHHLELLT